MNQLSSALQSLATSLGEGAQSLDMSSREYVKHELGIIMPDNFTNEDIRKAIMDMEAYDSQSNN